MREINFRAFDKKNKVMQYSNIVWAIDGLNYPALTGLNDNGNIDNLSDLMQFTGLKDKNGTPIYEGDIVKYIAGKNYQTIGVVTWADDKNSFNLKTYPLMCAFVIHNEKENKTDKFEWDETDYMEVIGNIYENPNLLERLINEKFYL